MSYRRAILLVSILVMPSLLANAQLVADFSEPSVLGTTSTTRALDFTYARPTQGTIFRDYVLDTFGPYPIADAALTAGLNQFSNAPPEWKQGSVGYFKRFGSDFALDAVETTTRYGLAELLREDTIYYRCECRGFFPRVSHAVLTTFTARRGEDGHRVFSIPAIVSPYAGSMTAVYGWYPDRFGAKDAFRLGSYSLFADMGGNLVHEFFHAGHHSALHLAHSKATDSNSNNELKP